MRDAKLKRDHQSPYPDQKTSDVADHNHTAVDQGGDYPWADFVVADVTYLQALVADITQTNLVDKSATEVISGTWQFTNTGLRLLDTDASHNLNLKPGSNLTANRILTITTGDADRTITLTGNPTLADWFDQAVKTTSSPTFVGVQAVDDLIITCGTDKTLVLAETVWDDLPPTPITAAKLGSTAPTLTTFVTDIEQYTFDATNDYVIGSTEIIHRWKEGTTIHPHVHFASNGSEGTAKGVQWQLSWSVGDVSEAFSAQTVSVIDVEIPASTADRTHFLSNFTPTINGTDLKIGAYILWRFERIATDHANGEPVANPFSLAVGFHAEQDTIG